MTHLRIALPRLDQFSASSDLECARLDRHGEVSETGVGSCLQLGQGARTRAVDYFLHPADSLLTSIDLPPLSAAKVAAAVTCAAQALILGDTQAMHVAHSARDASGQVHLSWLPRVALQRFAQLAASPRLKLRGLYPAPYRLPVPPAGQVSACVVEGYLLLRFSLERAAVEPRVQARLAQLAADGMALHWVDQAPPAHAAWSGTLPGWGLQGGVGKVAAGATGWGKALACCALALGIWVLGLNLYAAREAAQGQQLKAQMSQRVKQAFPELPVILNPLQQARQQLAARHEDKPGEVPRGFATMVRQAATALPFLAGSVQRLTFEPGQLQLQLSADTAPTADIVPPALGQAGLAVSRDGHLWTLRPLQAPADTPTTLEDDDE